MTSIKLELFDECIEDLTPLLISYWGEADERRDSSSMDLGFDTYKQLEDLGLLHIITCREKTTVVGFVVFLLSQCTHTGKQKACMEVLYVDAEYRGTGLARSILDIAEKEIDADYFFCTLKTEFPHNNLVKECGYSHVENVYMKEII